SIATRDGCSAREVNMTILVAFVAPDLVKAAIEGRSRTAWASSASPTCLPNGPASTRCSDFRRISSSFEPSLRRRRSSLPGNGFRGRRKRANTSPQTIDQRSQRRSGRTKSPRDAEDRFEFALVFVYWGIKFVEFGWYQESELAELPMPFIFVG